MKAQLIWGLGMALAILPAFSMGISYLDVDMWPPWTDFRWLLMGIGVILLLVGRVLHGRQVKGPN